MSRTRGTYRRLPGRRWLTAAGQTTLWLAPDHLLCVANHRITEDYLRFFYRDIQSLTLAVTAVRGVFNTVFLSLAGLSALAAATGDDSRPFWAVVTGLFLLLSLVNTLRGPTCTCHLTTAAHREQLPSLCRLRPATQALEEVRARAEAAQGRLTQGQAAEALLSEPEPAPTAFAPAGPPAPAAAVPRGVAAAAFAALAAAGALNGVTIFYRTVPLSLGGVLLLAVLIVVTAVALSRGGGPRRWLWASVGYAVASFTAGSVISTATMVVEGGNPSNPYQHMLRVYTTPSGGSPALVAVDVALAAAAWIIAAGGFLALRARRGPRGT